MDEMTLMLAGESRWCRDCDAETIHVPVDPGRAAWGEWCCTSCDAAVVVAIAA